MCGSMEGLPFVKREKMQSAEGLDKYPAAGSGSPWHDSFVRSKAGGGGIISTTPPSVRVSFDKKGLQAWRHGGGDYGSGQ
jgi:hypothetical protein